MVRTFASLPGLPRTWSCGEPQSQSGRRAMGCCCCSHCLLDAGDADAEAHRYEQFVEPAAAPRAARSDFEVLRLLGRGSYGKVLHVRKRDSGAVFAMKAMAKADVARRNQMGHALTERAVLRRVRHPYICALHYAFQTPSHLYLVLALQSGGELFFHLRREGAFSVARARLYAAEILLALGALHRAGFVYRDLKPENVLLDARGHISLSDFGLAKEGVRACDSGASTLCGTPSYMAPEVLRGRGHGLGVDWWGFGTLLYEMLGGVPPFYSRSLQSLYRNILHAEVRWRPRMGRAARSLLRELLRKEPTERAGARGPSEVQRCVGGRFRRRGSASLTGGLGHVPGTASSAGSTGAACCAAGTSPRSCRPWSAARRRRDCSTRPTLTRPSPSPLSRTRRRGTSRAAEGWAGWAG